MRLMSGIVIILKKLAKAAIFFAVITAKEDYRATYRLAAHVGLCYNMKKLANVYLFV